MPPDNSFFRNLQRIFKGLLVLSLLTYNACQSLDEEEILLFTIDKVDILPGNSYEMSGSIVNMGHLDIKEHGFCWSETETPTVENTAVLLGSPRKPGVFTFTVSGLLPDTSYHARAYVTTESGTVYSDEMVFRTLPGDEDRLIDIDGNIYETKQIGDQTWMAENLKVTRYADGTPIPFVEDQMEWFHLNRETRGYCWYDNVLTNGYVYGGLYTWTATVRGSAGSELIPGRIQGVCPDGWHVPSEGEWNQFELHLGMDQEELAQMKWRGDDEGGKLKEAGTRLWKSPNTGFGETGFNALPGGYRHGSGEFIGLVTTARFWTSTGRGYGFAWYRGLEYDHTGIYRDFIGSYRGHSVRCIKDE